MRAKGCIDTTIRAHTQAPASRDSAALVRSAIPPADREQNVEGNLTEESCKIEFYYNCITGWLGTRGMHTRYLGTGYQPGTGTFYSTVVFILENRYPVAGERVIAIVPCTTVLRRRTGTVVQYCTGIENTYSCTIVP